MFWLLPSSCFFLRPSVRGEGWKGRGGSTWLYPAQGRANLCGQWVTRWSGSSAGHPANFPPLFPSPISQIKLSAAGLPWALAALDLWAFCCLPFVGLTLPTGKSTKHKAVVKCAAESTVGCISMRRLRQRHCLGLAAQFPADSTL